MAGLINLRLLTDFFNKIGPKRRLAVSTLDDDDANVKYVRL
jgi:hypothetical protein